MKKVLMVSCGGLGQGGVQSVMMSIVRGLQGVCTFDIVLFTSEKRYYDDEFTSYGGKIFRFPRYEGNNLLRKKLDYYIRGKELRRSICKLLDNNRYDIIHCNNEYESSIFLKIAAERKIPVRICHTHIVSNHNKIFRAIFDHLRLQSINKYATNFIGCSESACEAFYGRRIKYQIINNPIDEKKFYYEAKDHSKNKTLRMVQIGQFDYNKNQCFSIRVLNKIMEKIPSAELCLVGFGEGEYYNQIKETISKYRLENNVVFYPSNCDIRSLLLDASLIIHPSYREGFGIVLIEAQACGKKCYTTDTVPRTTDCGGVTYLRLEDGYESWSSRIIDDYENGIIVDKEYNVSAFKAVNVCQQYLELYNSQSK